MKKSILLFLFISINLYGYGQNNSVSFSSDKLQEISARYSGNSLNWPVVLKLADHDISANTFTLSQASLLKLDNLAQVSATVSSQQTKINDLISEGASIFAKSELENANTLINQYIEFVRQGDLEMALETGSAVKPAIDKLEQTLNENRLVTVQAQLTKKDGNVDKRLGLLSGWQDAFVGDLFEEADGVRTYQESYATLIFTDGSNIIVNPRTTATIRKSRIDKLDESADTEITLVEGGLLSKLSALGKEKSNYILNAGSSTTELKTTNFYAQNDSDGLVKLSNYDGNAEVSANNVIVTIKKNEGTLVRENQAPLEPVKLLPAPTFFFQRKDSIIYRESFLLTFRTVENAEKYNIEYSTSYDFNTDVNSTEISDNRFLISNLPLGTTYLRVQSIDELGLKGPFSDVIRLIRNEDTKPPPIFGDQFSRNIIFTQNKSVTITGVTEPDAKVTVDGTKITPSKSGEFSAFVALQNFDQIITVTSTDGSQNKTTKELRVAQLDEEYLFDLRINGQPSNSEISSVNSTKTITGRAFPEMEIELVNGNKTQLVKTDSQGRWGITMDVQQGKLSVTFRTNQNGISPLTKTYTVQ